MPASPEISDGGEVARVQLGEVDHAAQATQRVRPTDHDRAEPHPPRQHERDLTDR